MYVCVYLCTIYVSVYIFAWKFLYFLILPFLGFPFSFLSGDKHNSASGMIRTNDPFMCVSPACCPHPGTVFFVPGLIFFSLFDFSVFGLILLLICFSTPHFKQRH